MNSTKSCYTVDVSDAVTALGIWSRSCWYKIEQKDLEIWR